MPFKKNETNVSASKVASDQGEIVESNSSADSSSLVNYQSRYEDDFQEIEKLGGGAFGVVFKAKNKIDDHLYAIKRIRLPRRKGVQERYLREAKVLAKLDHNNIVRYYQTWVESPPTALHDKWKSERETRDDSSTSSSENTSVNYNAETDENVVLNELQNLHHFEKMSTDSPAPFNSSEPSKSNGSGSSLITFEHSQASRSIESNGYKSATVSKNSSLSNFEGSAAGNDKPTKNQPTQYLFIQMELCSETTLQERLRKMMARKSIYKELLEIFRQIVAAVSYVHSRELIHRDLKPSNIFFSLTHARIKVGDFGLVTEIEGDEDLITSHSKGTPLYKSPEQIFGKPYTQKVDIYALGIIFFELLQPFNTVLERIAVITDAKNHKLPEEFKSTWSEQVIEFLDSMLSEDPEKRPSAAEIEKSFVGLEKKMRLTPPEDPEKRPSAAEIEKSFVGLEKKMKLTPLSVINKIKFQITQKERSWTL